MNAAASARYDVALVAFSYLIAVVGSLVALTGARHIRGRDGRISAYAALTAGTALGGVGVWSMHFTGMLALDIRMGVSYSMFETLVSLIAAVLATAAALAYVAKDPTRLGRILSAGVLLGLGVVVMHYLGMAGMRFGGFITWSIPLVMASVLIAIVAACAALWLAFRTATWPARILAALVMGLAVCAMHYTGMAAADFICTTANRHAVPDGLGVVSSFHMPVWVALCAMAVSFVLVFDLMLRANSEAALAHR